MSSVTVTVPMTIRRRGGRKQIIGPDGAPMQAGEGGADVAFTRGDPAQVKALARAFRWRRMLEEGRYGSIRELAAAEGVDRAYVAFGGPVDGRTITPLCSLLRPLRRPVTGTRPKGWNVCVVRKAGAGTPRQPVDTGTI